MAEHLGHPAHTDGKERFARRGIHWREADLDGIQPIELSVPAIRVVDVGAGQMGRPGITPSKGGEDELHDGLV